MHCAYPREHLGSTLGLFRPTIRSSLVLAALVLVCFAPASQGQVRKNVLMINIIGQSHPGPLVVTNLVLSALHSDPRFQVEFYWENLDAVYHPEEWQEQLDAVVQQYRHRKLDLIVLLGPDAIRDPDRAEDDIPQCPGGLLLHRSRSDRPDETRLPIDGLVVSIGAREDGGGCAGSATGNPPHLRSRGRNPIMTDVSPRW